MRVEERIAEHKREIDLCDAQERESANPRMMSAALIIAGIGVSVASLIAYETIGLTLGIVGVVGGFVWRSDLNHKALWRSRLRDAHRAALKSLLER